MGRALILLVLLCTTGCAPRVETTVVKGEAPPALLVEESPPPLVDDLDGESLCLAISRSLAHYNKLPESTLFRFGDRQVSVGRLKESLTAFLEILRSGGPAESREERIRQSFGVYRAGVTEGAILMTGYYEPVLEGSRIKSEKYRYPIYGVPDDLVVTGAGGKGGMAAGRWDKGTMVPYYSRAEIEEGGVLAGRNLEIAWLADPVDLFMLHIQGSGRIRYPDGSSIQVGYARSNSRPFRSVARYLLTNGKITERETSYEAIKNYLKAQPEKELFPILSYNECYIFFRTVPEGPRGALGVLLTEGRSIAIDPEIYPKGGIAFIRARKPVRGEREGTVAWVPFSRFVLSQDAGVAIKGPGRVDLFCGSGEDAEWYAGSLKEKGELYFLLRKQ